MVQLSNPYMTTGKTIALTIWPFISKVMSLLFNMVYRFFIIFLPKSKHLLISWPQSLSAVILEPQKNKICHCQVQLFVNPWTVAYQAPLSMGFFRQEYWSGLPFPSPGDLPDPGMEPGSTALQSDSTLSEPSGKPRSAIHTQVYMYRSAIHISLFFGCPPHLGQHRTLSRVP